MNKERESVLHSMTQQPSSIIYSISAYIRDLRQLLRVIPLRERQPIGIAVSWSNEDWNTSVTTYNCYFEYACMLYNLAIAYYVDGLQYVGTTPDKSLEAIQRSIRTMETILSVCTLAYQSDITLQSMSFDGLSAMIALLKTMYHMIVIDKEANASPTNLASLCEAVVSYVKTAYKALPPEMAISMRWLSKYYRLKGRLYQCYSLRQSDDPDRFDKIKQLTDKFDTVDQTSMTQGNGVNGERLRSWKALKECAERMKQEAVTATGCTIAQQVYTIPTAPVIDRLGNTAFKVELPQMEPFLETMVPALYREKIEEYHRFVEEKLREELRSVYDFLEKVNDDQWNVTLDTVLSEVCPFYVLRSMRLGPSHMSVIEGEEKKVADLFVSIQSTLNGIQNDCDLDENDVADESLEISLPQVLREVKRIDDELQSNKRPISSFMERAKYLLDRRNFLSLTPQEVNQKFPNTSASNELRYKASQLMNIVGNNREKVEEVRRLLKELDQITRCDALVRNDVLTYGVNNNFEGVFTRSYNCLHVYVEKLLQIIREYQKDYNRNLGDYTSLKKSIAENTVLYQRYQYFRFMNMLEGCKDGIVADAEKWYPFLQQVERKITEKLAEPIEILQRRKEWRKKNLDGMRVCKRCNALNEASAKNCVVCGHWLFPVCINKERSVSDSIDWTSSWLASSFHLYVRLEYRASPSWLEGDSTLALSSSR